MHKILAQGYRNCGMLKKAGAVEKPITSEALRIANARRHVIAPAVARWQFWSLQSRPHPYLVLRQGSLAQPSEAINLTFITLSGIPHS